MYHLTHKENIEETTELLIKLERLSLTLQILWKCVVQNIPLRGHRDSAKNDAELAENDGNIMAKSWQKGKKPCQPN